jgi:HK97 family phage major capsid protein
MADLKTMREERAKLITQSRSLIDESDSVTDEARAAELETQADKAMSDVGVLDAKISRAEKLETLERSVKDAEERQRQQKRPNQGGNIVQGAGDGDEITYRSAFHSYIRNQGQLGSMSAEERTVLTRGYSAIETRAQTTTNAAGGYSIPEEMLPELVRSMKAFGPMYDGNITREMVTSGGNPMPFPTVNDTASTAGAHTEGATLTDDGGKDVTFGTKQLDAFAFDTEWLRISKELADDSFLAWEALIGSLLGERLGRIANLQLTTGTGSSAPNGIVTASALGKTATGTAAITADEMLDLEHSVDPAYRSAPGVGYMFNDSTLLALRKLKDGDGNYLWQMGNVQAGVPNTFNGRPYHINQDMASLATGQKVALFGDFKKYFVRKVGTPLIGAIQDKDFWPGFGVAGYIRFDGELSDTAAVKHLITA